MVALHSFLLTMDFFQSISLEEGIWTWTDVEIPDWPEHTICEDCEGLVDFEHCRWRFRESFKTASPTESCAAKSV